MDISVIIVSYNTADLTLRCIASVRSSTGEKEIFVVDNASTDGSAAAVRKKFPEVPLIENPQNLGFGAANNRALKICRGRYVVFLNPDTVVRPDALSRAVSYMDAHPDIGLAGARILNPDGSPQESISWRYPGEKFAKDETKGLPGKIACVLGAFMIARRPLIDELGGFDEDFFLYGEDEDLAWRVREKGFSIGYIEEAEVFHWGGRSEAQTPPPEVFAKKLLAEYLFYAKHYRPQTVARIKRSQRRKAIYRLITLGLTAPFSRDRFAHENKTRRYRLMLDMAKP
ncbi:MAG TPA: glycosyltransferase family 2 protein [Smithellaceae bacterium]|nr:glycosyltransferase family 2 protein [Smithellaceae bacterium]